MTPEWPAVSTKTLLKHFDIEAPDIEVTDMVLDSREVAIHKLFVAVKGHSLDGREFIPQAISLGAKVILSESDSLAQHGEIQMREHSVIIAFYELSQHLSHLASLFFHAPSEKLDVTAVTGTNGKTSTTHFVCQLGELLSQPSAFIGTLGAGLLSEISDTMNTTPDAISMHRLMAAMVNKGAKQVAFEASSHALVQNRIKQVKTDVAVFTNLSRDHLDYHGDMKEYARAKRLLLRQPGLRFAVLNANEPEHLNWLKEIPNGIEPVLFGIETTISNRYKYCVARDLVFEDNGVRFTLDSSWGEGEVQSPLLGEFNVSNLLAALVAQLCLGNNFEEVISAIAKMAAVAGRIEKISQPAKPTFVVDYAHTPDALEKVLKTLKSHSSAKLWCVFGCGGDRDQGKRPMMGEVAEQYADEVVITTDNSRNENPMSIASEILQGTKNPDAIVVELDRKKAIKNTLQQADANDMVLVAGKGHETYQIIGDETIQYDERSYLKQLLQGEA